MALTCGAAVGFVGCSDFVTVETSRPMFPMPEPTPCTLGEACRCAWGYSGICEDAKKGCECTQCPALEAPASPVVTSCGGAVAGTWTLTQQKFGPAPIDLTVDGSSVGSCDSVISTKGQPPPVVMTLEETSPNSGDATYSADSVPLTQSWSEACVLRKIATFSCGSSSWTNVSNCNLDCDICSCDIASTAFTGTGEWNSDGPTIVLAPWGVSTSFDYCITGDTMELSADGAYLVFERTAQ